MNVPCYDNMIELDNVSMRYNVSKEKIDNLKEYLIRLATRRLYFEEFWALSDITCKIRRGEVFGIVGDNGAGKSTLLKVIAGVLKPSRGNILVKGNMAPLIELGAGFDYALSARENIFLNGAILCYPRDFIKEKLEQIIEFSELREFMEMPLKNFSSGMTARLGFAIATITEPDILIVDEILAVGDNKFQEKCIKKIDGLLKRETTVVMVSHNIRQLSDMCEKVLWLEHGKMRMLGDAKEVCDLYLAEKDKLF